VGHDHFVRIASRRPVPPQDFPVPYARDSAVLCLEFLVSDPLRQVRSRRKVLVNPEIAGQSVLHPAR